MALMNIATKFHHLLWTNLNAVTATLCQYWSLLSSQSPVPSEPTVETTFAESLMRRRRDGGLPRDRASGPCQDLAGQGRHVGPQWILRYPLSFCRIPGGYLRFHERRS